MLGDAELRDDEAARAAAQAFLPSPVQAPDVAYVQTSENAVYRVQADSTYFLRMVPAARRIPPQIEAELEFIRYLGEGGLSVSLPLLSSQGEGVVSVESEHGRFLCSLFEAAPGKTVEAFSEGWNEALFTAWGRALGRLHAASARYAAPSRNERWEWFEEPALAEAETLDEAAFLELNEIKAALASLGNGGYGLIHGDFGRINFHVDDKGTITVFDFDDCCHHHFAYDVAVALWPLRHQPEEARSRTLAWMMAGYCREVEVDPDFMERLRWLFRLRSVFMYLYHVHKWGRTSDPERQKWLDRLRAGFGTVVWS